MGRFAGVLGMVVLVGLAYLFSTARKEIKLKTVLWGLGLQLAFGVFVLKFAVGRLIFQAAGDAVNKLLSFAFNGSEFVFSPLGARAVQWAINVAYCESRYHPNSVNTDSGASGLFQFMPGTWSGTPWAGQSPFDPVANAQAAAWLYNRYGPGRWTCQG